MSVKLYYFDGRGICEPIRIILSYGGIQFEDVRAPVTAIPATIPLELKKRCRWGQVPLVEIDGKILNQSLAIARYFAKQANLIPSDPFEAAKCDEYVDAANDLLNPWYFNVFLERDEEKRKLSIQETKKASKERFLGVFEAIIKANDGKHLVGNSLTWADICLFHSLNHAENLVGVNQIDHSPVLKAHYDNVVNTPAIKAWLEKRPKTKL